MFWKCFQQDVCIASYGLHLRSTKDLLLGLPGTAAKLKNKRTKNEQMLTDVRQPGQLIVSDQMFIASTSCQAFANAFVSSAIISHIHFQT